MPKCKSNDCDRIKHKIRKLEKKLRRKQRRTRDRYYSDDSELSSKSGSSSHRSPLDYQDNEYLELFEPEDGNLVQSVLEPEQDPELEPVSEPVLNREPDPEPESDRESELKNSVQIPSVVQTVSNFVDPSVLSTAPEPGTSADSQATPATEDLELDSELLDILGPDPTTDTKYGKDIQKDLSIRFQHWTTMGLPKELRKELKEKYLTPENAKLIDPPKLNAEIKAAVSDIFIKRDKAIESKQRKLASAITSLGEAITILISTKDKNTTLLKLLMDSARIICDCQHADTVKRRNFLLNAVKKEVREQLKNTKIDKLLFGEKLAETLKSAKAIYKTSTDLKQPTRKLPNKRLTLNTASTSRHLNWTNPGPVRRQTGPPRTKEPATTSTRGRPANSKQSHHPQQR